MAPVLGLVFQYVNENYLLAASLLLAYGLGNCILIVGAGTLTGKVQKYLDWSEGSKIILRIKQICGILLILGGIFLIFNSH